MCTNNQRCFAFFASCLLYYFMICVYYYFMVWQTEHSFSMQTHHWKPAYSSVPLTSCILELLKGKGKAQSIRLEIRLFKPPLEAVQHHLGWFDAFVTFTPPVSKHSMETGSVPHDNRDEGTMRLCWNYSSHSPGLIKATGRKLLQRFQTFGHAGGVTC